MIVFVGIIFIFLKKRLIRFENDDEKTKNETIVFERNRFSKTVVLKTIAFKDDCFFRRFVNDH